MPQDCGVTDVYLYVNREKQTAIKRYFGWLQNLNGTSYQQKEALSYLIAKAKKFHKDKLYQQRKWKPIENL